MPHRPPLANVTSEGAFDALQHELLAEKAAALGRAGETMERALSRLAGAVEGDAAEDERLSREAARAVYAYFIQRELCGFRRHDDIIRQYAIPKKVLVRLGAC